MRVSGLGVGAVCVGVVSVGGVGVGAEIWMCVVAIGVRVKRRGHIRPKNLTTLTALWTTAMTLAPPSSVAMWMVAAATVGPAISGQPFELKWAGE